MLTRALHYGAPGTKKSRAAALAVKELNGVVIDMDDGWGVLSRDFGIPYVTQEDFEKEDISGKIVFVPFDKPERVLSVVKLLNKAYKRDPANPLTKLLVFDGFTQFGDKNYAKQLKKRNAEIKSGVEMGSLDPQGWGYLLTDYIHLVANMVPRETGAHLYATAMMGDRADPLDEDITILQPELTGGFRAKVAGFFDVTFPTFKRIVRSDGESRTVYRTYFAEENNPLSSANFQVINRDQRVELPPYMDDFDLLTLINIMEKING